MRRFPALLLTATMVALAGVAGDRAASAQPVAVLKLPFPGGTAWKVIQGYNGGTHVPGPEQYALDLARDGGPTAGTDVVAPSSGTVWWMNPPGSGNGCLLIKMDNGGGLIVEMCHIFARPFQTDQRIEVGQLVGTIGPPGTVGNNGTAHLHLSLHRTPDLGVTRIPAPFALPDGLALDGVSLLADGSPNQYACPGAGCRPSFISTNGPGSGAAPATTPGTLPVPLPIPAPIPASAPPSVSLRAGVVARVAAGPLPGDCVNVREGPGMTARVLACLPDGTSVTIAQGPLVADGRSWWKLDGVGWAASDYLAGVSAPIPALRAGGRAIVDAGTDDCLNLRVAPGMSAQVIACLPSGARVGVTDGPRDADGHTWWQIDGGGWAAADYLQPRDES